MTRSSDRGQTQIERFLGDNGDDSEEGEKKVAGDDH